MASGLGAQQARMDVVTNNIANVSTNGYKQDSVTVKNLSGNAFAGEDGG